MTSITLNILMTELLILIVFPVHRLVIVVFSSYHKFYSILSVLQSFAAFP